MPTAERTKEDYVSSLTPDALLFAPGTGILYSKFGFDLSGAGARATSPVNPIQACSRRACSTRAGLKDTSSTSPRSRQEPD